MDNIEIKKLKKERQDKKHNYKRDIYTGEHTLKELLEYDDEFLDMYIEAPDTFEKLQTLYYKNHNTTPTSRINLVVAGDLDNGKVIGRTGKSTLTNLFMDYFHYKDNDSIFVFNTSGLFNGYTNETKIVWEEIRSYDLFNSISIPTFLQICNTGQYNNCFVNVKYGYCKPCNYVNAINTSQSFSDFYGRLCYKKKLDDNDYSKPEDFNQVSERLPVCLCLSKRGLGNGSFITTIKCMVFNETKEQKDDFSHFDLLFSVDIPTTKWDYDIQLKKFMDWFINMVDMDIGQWDYESKDFLDWLEEYKLYSSVEKVPEEIWKHIMLPSSIYVNQKAELPNLKWEQTTELERKNYFVQNLKQKLDWDKIKNYEPIPPFTIDRTRE